MSSFSATQQANFAKNSDPAQGVSLCIPRVFNNIGWRRIKQHIIDANLGYVERVDVVPVAGGKYKRAFVHFAAGKWNMRDATARAALKALQEGKKIKLEYESPWYWLVGISGAARPAEAPKPRERKTRIDLTATSKPAAKASYDLSAQQDEELAPPKLTRQHAQVMVDDEMDLNDPIMARAMASNSPQSLDALPKQLRHFDEVEDAIEAGGGEEGEIVENSN
jgi:hypothetical protein